MAATTSEGTVKTAHTTATPPPIVIDLGSKKRKQVKQLREGRGKLMDQVNSALQELKTSGTIDQDSQPVVVIVSPRPKRPVWPLGMF